MLLKNALVLAKNGGEPVRSGCCFCVAGASSNVGAPYLAGTLRLLLPKMLLLSGLLELLNIPICMFRSDFVNCCLGKALKFCGKPLERMFCDSDFSCCWCDGVCRNVGVGESCGKEGGGGREPWVSV